MIDYLGKSVKSFYHNLSPEVKGEIENVKIASLLISNDNNKRESTVIFLYLPRNQLNVYQMIDDFSIEFQCIYSNKFSFSLTNVEPLNYLSKYKEDSPLIAIVSNSLEGNNSNNNNLGHYIHFISLKNDNVLLSLDYPYMIYTTCFKHKYFGVGLSNGTITVYDNNTLHPICTIDNKGIKFKDIKGLTNLNISESITIQSQKNFSSDKHQGLMKENKIEEGNTFYSYYPDTKTSINAKEFNNDSNQEIRDSYSKQPQSLYLNQDISMFQLSNKDDIYMPVFDLTENYIIYHINKKSNIKSNQLSEPQSQNHNTASAFDLAFGALKNLKEWSFKSINNYSSLLKSTNIKTNDEIAKLKATPLYISVLNLSISSEKEFNEKIDKIIVPFFKDGLSTISTIKNGKYIIIGNKNSQLFFVYELYPQTNLKYSNEGQSYKIIYSLFRGNRSTHINSIDITKYFAVITSQRGTHHVYSLPNRDQQIIESINEAITSKQSSSSSSSQGTDYLNQKITNGIEISTLRQIGQVFYSKIVSIDKVYLDNSIIAKMVSSDQNSNSRFTSVVRNENYLITICDNSIEIHLLYNNDKMILLKKQNLQFNEDKDIIKNNFAVNLQPEPIQVSKIQMNKRFLVETDTTDKNFCIMQTNPLFSFNIISSYNQFLSTDSNLIIECPILFSIFSIQISQNERKSVALFQPSRLLNEKNEIYLYESFLCKEQAYLPFNKKQFNIDSSNSKSKNRNSLDLYSEMLSAKKIIINPKYEENYNSIDIKNNFYNNKDNILENNIKNALETNIKDNISSKNSVKKPEDFIIQDNYYN